MSQVCCIVLSLGFALALLSLPPLAIAAEPASMPAEADQLDSDLPDGIGHFYKQANGKGGEGELGYTITNAGDIPFWDEYRRLGGPDVLGYPVTRRFVWDGFTVQVTQKAVLQWRSDTKSFAFVNVLDRMHELGKDDWLRDFRQTPPPFDTKPDAGLSWEEVVRRHLEFLDQNEAIKERFLSNSTWLDHYGLPVSYADMGNSFVMRAQRAVFQYWKEEVPWAQKGEVTIANAGDLAKEAAIFPGLAVTPQLPPGATQPITPPCQTIPVRGFGLAWSEHPELYELLECPSYPPQEQASDVALQRFERGWMLWVRTPSMVYSGAPPQTPQIFVLFEDNQTMASFPDTWAEGSDLVTTGLTSPEGMLEPQRGFGKVWREGTGVKVRERLGWAVEPDKGGAGAWQMFWRGRMVWTPDPRLVFALAERTESYQPLNVWRVYPDKYQQ